MTFDLEKNEFNYVFHQFDHLFKDMDEARFHEGAVVGILHGAKKDGVTPGADYVYRFIQGLQERVRLEKNRNMHQKHKRCLAMAEWCNSEMGRETFACFRPRNTKEVWREEHKYWAKWRKRWLELAGMFKKALYQETYHDLESQERLNAEYERKAHTYSREQLIELRERINEAFLLNPYGKVFHVDRVEPDKFDITVDV